MKVSNLDTIEFIFNFNFIYSVFMYFKDSRFSEDYL